MKKFAMIGLLSIVLGVAGLFMFGNQFFITNATEAVSEQQTIDATDRESIMVKADVGSVSIEKSSDQDIHVSLVGNISEQNKKRLHLSVEDNGEEVRIELNRKRQIWLSWLSIGGNSNVQLVVALPEQSYQRLKVELDVGELQVRDGVFDTLDLETNVGSVEVSSIVSQNSKISVNVGEVKIDRAIGSWDVKTDIGDVSIQMDQWNEDIQAKVNIGEVSVTVPEEPEAYRIDVKAGLGDLRIRDFNQLNQPGSRQHSEQVGVGGPSIEASVDIGSVNIRVW